MPSPTVPLEDLPTVQRAALECLWDRGPSTVQEVVGVVSTPDRPAPYTTVLTALQRLEQAGWVTHAAKPGFLRGRVYVYAPVGSRDEARDRVAARVVTEFFAGDPFALAQRLVGHEDLSADELAELRRLIDRRRKADADRAGDPDPR